MPSKTTLDARVQENKLIYDSKLDGTVELGTITSWEEGEPKHYVAFVWVPYPLFSADAEDPELSKALRNEIERRDYIVHETLHPKSFFLKKDSTITDKDDLDADILGIGKVLAKYAEIYAKKQSLAANSNDAV